MFEKVPPAAVTTGGEGGLLWGYAEEANREALDLERLEVRKIPPSKSQLLAVLAGSGDDAGEVAFLRVGTPKDGRADLDPAPRREWGRLHWIGFRLFGGCSGDGRLLSGGLRRGLRNGWWRRRLSRHSRKGHSASTRHRSIQQTPSTIAVRYILDRYDVSPSLARTIAALAMLGGR